MLELDVRLTADKQVLGPKQSEQKAHVYTIFLQASFLWLKTPLPEISKDRNILTLKLTPLRTKKNVCLIRSVYIYIWRLKCNISTGLTPWPSELSI